jgi:RNA polymerase sigma-70 factor (ECF subfamily)
MQQADEPALIAAAVGGDHGAFRVLVEAYAERLHRLIGRFTRDPGEIEDLAQEVFVKVYRKLGTFQHESAFYTWLYRIAVNTASDAFQRRKRNPVRSVEDPTLFACDKAGDSRAPTPARGEGPPEEGLMEEELREVTRGILATIPEKFRTVLMLREYEDLSYEEMAQVLGISCGTIESRLFRARARFKEKMLRLYPGYFAG